VNVPVRDVLEVAALGLVVAAVALAAGLWPALLAAAAGLGYLSHAWQWDDVHVGRRKPHVPPVPPGPATSHDRAAR
jgi:hypothetical protein